MRPGIDLHLHSWYSDGSLSPERLIQEAKRRGMGAVALTDHDGTFGIQEALVAGKECGVAVVAGVELSSFLKTSDCTMHILGYGIHWKQEDLQRRMEEIRGQRRERNERLLRVLNELGFALSAEEMQLYPGQDYIGKPNIARALVNRGYAKSVEEVFASPQMLAAPQVRAIHRQKIAAEEAIRLIHGAGGAAILAHPMKVFYNGRPQVRSFAFDSATHGTYRERLEEILQKLITLGLDGMECFYHNHRREETEYLLQLAWDNDLLITAGSDYHGPGMRSGVEVGSCWQDEMAGLAVANGGTFAEGQRAVADALDVFLRRQERISKACTDFCGLR